MGIPLPLSGNGIVMAWVHSLSGIICIRIGSDILDADNLKHKVGKKGGGESVLRHAPVVTWVTSLSELHVEVHIPSQKG